MNQVNMILKNKKYQSAMEKLYHLEKERIYCKHGLEHQLDVARIAYILSLEEKIRVEKAVIYSAAFLHDIGRSVSLCSSAHEEESIKIAEVILKECNFNEEDIKEILRAIGTHREKEMGERVWKGILYRADKLSRNCFCCASSHSCYWSEEKKNKEIMG